MKILIAILLVALLAFSLGLYFPWWTVALAAALTAFLLDMKPFHGFIAGLLGAFLLWAGLAMFRSVSNEHILAHRMSEFILKKDSPVSLILMTGLIGGLVGGLGALCGSLIRRIGQKERV